MGIQTVSQALDYEGRGSPYGFKNRIINGAMVIDQRNAGASTTPAATYTLDRWLGIQAGAASKYSVQQNVGSVTPPNGFTKYAGITSLSAYAVTSADYYQLKQLIEGYNVADLNWGTTSASSITVSFWVRSSLNGSFGFVVAWGGTSANQRAYPVLYTISATNTWEYKTITIPGDTTMAGGGFETSNNTGIQIRFSLGGGTTNAGPSGAWAGTNYQTVVGDTSVVGTNGATFYITGVQLERGTQATAFDYRPYGTELALCQRYYEKSFSLGTKPIQNVGSTSGTLLASNYIGTASAIVASTGFMVSKRVVPTTITTYNPFAASAGWSRSGSGDFAASDYATGENSIGLRVDGATSTTSGNMSIHWSVEAEL